MSQAMTLKEAMAERGLTAADLGAFFGVTEAHAARWMDHQNKIRRDQLQKLRIEFLGMGVDTFEPIKRELTGVQFDVRANTRRWKKANAMPKTERKINYPRCYPFGISPEEFIMVRSLGGGPRKNGILLRKIIDYATGLNSKRIRTIKKLIGMSLEELQTARAGSTRGPISTVVHLTDTQLDNLRWLALSHGLTIEQTIKKYLREYYQIMKGQQI